MPNRIIKESICSNEQIDMLSPFEETFFYRLIVNVDDFGRMDGRFSILRSRLFPLKTIRDDQIEKALHSLATAELVYRYTVHGKPFVSLSGWERNQMIRAKKSKYPAPEEADECSDAKASESICNQMISDEIKCTRNPIQSNPNPTQSEAGNACAGECGGVEKYARDNLAYLSLSNMQELASFLDDLPSDVVRYAIDEACAQGKRTYGYVKGILNRYLQNGFKTVGDIKAYEDMRDKAKQRKREEENILTTHPPKNERWF